MSNPSIRPRATGGEQGALPNRFAPVALVHLDGFDERRGAREFVRCAQGVLAQRNPRLMLRFAGVTRLMFASRGQQERRGAVEARHESPVGRCGEVRTVCACRVRHVAIQIPLQGILAQRTRSVPKSIERYSHGISLIRVEQPTASRPQRKNELTSVLPPSLGGVRNPLGASMRRESCGNSNISSRTPQAGDRPWLARRQRLRPLAPSQNSSSLIENGIHNA
jgi:hypothetical protein